MPITYKAIHSEYQHQTGEARQLPFKHTTFWWLIVELMQKVVCSITIMVWRDPGLLIRRMLTISPNSVVRWYGSRLLNPCQLQVRRPVPQTRSQARRLAPCPAYCNWSCSQAWRMHSSVQGRVRVSHVHAGYSGGPTGCLCTLMTRFPGPMMDLFSRGGVITDGTWSQTLWPSVFGLMGPRLLKLTRRAETAILKKTGDATLQILQVFRLHAVLVASFLPPLHSPRHEARELPLQCRRRQPLEAHRLAYSSAYHKAGAAALAR